MDYPIRHIITCTALALYSVLMLSLNALGQEEPEKYYNLNRPSFDRQKYHFGFIIGINQSDFIVKEKPDTNFSRGLVVLDNQRLPGFNLGIVSSYNLTRNISFRFVPTLSFQDRKLSYTFQGGPDSTITFHKIVETTFVELPVYVKLRTDRIGNFAGYAIGGGKYMIDMSSKKLTDLEADKDRLVRVDKHQMALEFGGGADFFLPYFKFGIEIKMMVGIGNVMIDDDSRFTRPLESLTSKGYVITFTFEG